MTTNGKSDTNGDAPKIAGISERELLIAEIVHNRMRANQKGLGDCFEKYGKRIRQVDGYDLLTIFTFPLDELRQTAKLTRQIDLDFDFEKDVAQDWLKGQVVK